MKRALPPLFETEAQLCASFIEWAEPQGWVAYPETADFDILMVRKSDGVQIGIQAKLKFNIKVLQQILPPQYLQCGRVGPDYRAVLVPGDGSDAICAYLGLKLIQPARNNSQPWAWNDPLLREHGFHSDWHDWNPEKRCKLPDYVPDVLAGDSGPVQLTQWKIGALKIIAILELRGFVTRADFNFCKIDSRRWISSSTWLQPGVERGQYVRGEALTFDQQHPKVYPEIKAKMAEYVQAHGNLLVAA